MNTQRVKIVGDCWIYQKSTNGIGYCQMSVNGKDSLVHRLSYSLFNGPLNYNQKVLHSCDNRACINPAHLRIGTQKENVKDMVDRGRARKGKKATNENGTKYISSNIEQQERI